MRDVNRRAGSCILVAGLVFLASCAVVPTVKEPAGTGGKAFQPPPGKANLYLVRASIAGTAVAFHTLIDDSFIGLLPIRTYLLVPIEPGTHTLSAFMPAVPQKAMHAKFTAEAGKNYFFKVKCHPIALKAEPLPLSEKKGRATVEGLKRAIGGQE